MLITRRVTAPSWHGGGTRPPSDHLHVPFDLAKVRPELLFAPGLPVREVHELVEARREPSPLPQGPVDLVHLPEQLGPRVVRDLRDERALLPDLHEPVEPDRGLLVRRGRAGWGPPPRSPPPPPPPPLPGGAVPAA